MTVRFIDTSVLCNLVPIPGRDSERRVVLQELSGYIASGDILILPVTSVIEAGNFIAQLGDGNLRRIAATNLAGQLELAVAGKAPYTFHDFSWNQAFVRNFLDGAGTGQTFIEHASSSLGAGDLLILTEMASYRSRARIPVRLWTHDHQLAAHGPPDD